MMTKIYRLAEADFEKVRQLFAQLDAHLAPQAVIAGVAPGTIYVDDSAEPCAAFLHVQQRFYLAGDPQCSDFNEGLHCLFDDVIFPEAPETGQEAFVLIYVPGWEAAIETVILRDKFPLPDQRHTYIFRDANLKIDWRSLLKPGDAVHKIDAALLADDSLGNIGALREEVLSEAPSTALFLRDRFGVCLVREDTELVGWALSEYNLGARCEVGIETVAGYRRQGIAIITGGALVEEALSQGFVHIGWHCWASNAGSVATALRLGFERVEETEVYFAWFDEVTNLAVNGNVRLFRDAYDEALAWYERAFEVGDAPWWAYWNAARAAVSVGENERALRYLQKVVEGGLQNLEAIRESEHLQGLRKMDAWQDVLASLNVGG